MRWGKVIDHDRCIGCHACSVACKSENGVPLGSFRTWVKYVEKGVFPEVKRHFAVLRCNQCDNSPCTQICPTKAMYRRPDGIVDFDNEICIGCKSCIQACPYDAIYMDPDSNTAAKCHFCAHRVEIGLEPACVTACPERALLVGDLDDPLSIVSKIVGRETTSVRKPELGTRPKVFYKGVDESCIRPDAAARPTQSLWGGGRTLPMLDEDSKTPPPPNPQTAGPGGRQAAALVAYDVPRDGSPWGWKISAYLFTKSLGGGALIVGGLMPLLATPPTWPLLAPLLALLFLSLTGVLLVADLKRPERFYYLLLRPQWGSWLVKGAYCILAALAVAATWAALALFEPGGPSGGEQTVLSWLAIATGIAAAGYTAFLFGQARGRAFWQSPLLLPHLVLQAFMAGTALLLVLLPLYVVDLTGHKGVLERSTVQVEGRLAAFLIAALVGDALAIGSDLFSHVGPEDARQAARSITKGRFRDYFWFGVLAPRLGALALLGWHFASASPSVGVQELAARPWATIAAALVLVGIAAWEHVYVLAGQEPPLS